MIIKNATAVGPFEINSFPCALRVGQEIKPISQTIMIKAAEKYAEKSAFYTNVGPVLNSKLCSL